MPRCTLLLVLLASFAVSSFAANWALLVAGSNGWWNYRHQADICHAYQILHKGGIPDSNIVVMMYDDIASDSSNPTPGIIINKPNGTDVYHGVVKDYVGADVTAANFLNILSGNATAMKGIGSGKVIDSGPNDRVFVYYSDHGGTDLVCFPTGDYLYSKDLTATLTSMAANKQFKELVFYLEACESGSMFNNHLPANINIYTTTASTPFESSYACYDDETRQTYLGDCYSVNWMENTDAVDPRKETLQQQFVIIRNETASTSTVCQYGQLSISTEPVSNYVQKSGAHAATYNVAGRAVSAIDQRDAKLAHFRKRYESSNSVEQSAYWLHAYTMEAQKRASADATFGKLAKLVVQSGVLTGPYPPVASNDPCKSQTERNFSCYKAVMQLTETKCGKFDEYSMKYSRTLAELCDAGATVQSIERALNSVCSSKI